MEENEMFYVRKYKFSVHDRIYICNKGGDNMKNFIIGFRIYLKIVFFTFACLKNFISDFHR